MPLVQSRLGRAEGGKRAEDRGSGAASESGRGHDFGRLPLNAAVDLNRQASPKTTMPIQCKLEVSKPGDQDEQEADRFAAEFVSVPARARVAVQCKLEVGQPDSQAECEADAAANRVMAMPDSEDGAARQGAGLQKRCGPEGAFSISADLGDRIKALEGSGEGLSPALRAFFEPRFVHNFSRVRVHTAPAAAATARDLGARAYTRGTDIVFAAGEYTPATDRGRALIAHELAHVVQDLPRVARSPSHPGVGGLAAGQMVVAMQGFDLMDKPGDTPGQRKLRRARSGDLFKIVSAIQPGVAYYVVAMKDSATEEVEDGGGRVVGVVSASWVRVAPAEAASALESPAGPTVPAGPGSPAGSSVGIEEDREELSPFDGIDYGKDPMYVDNNLAKAEYDCSTDELWLIYRSGAWLGLAYPPLRSALLAPGGFGAAFYWRDRRSGVIFPFFYHRSTAPNLAAIVKDIDSQIASEQCVQNIGMDIASAFLPLLVDIRASPKSAPIRGTNRQPSPLRTQQAGRLQHPWPVRANEGLLPKSARVAQPGSPMRLDPKISDRYLYVVKEDGRIIYAPQRIVNGAEAVKHTDLAELGAARVSGEIRYNAGQRVWEMDAASGRYSSAPITPGSPYRVGTRNAENLKAAVELARRSGTDAKIVHKWP